jgi:hypothetical protein
LKLLLPKPGHAVSDSVRQRATGPALGVDDCDLPLLILDMRFELPCGPAARDRDIDFVIEERAAALGAR